MAEYCECPYCEGCERAPPPTPEQIAAEAERRERIDLARWTPARDSLEQMDRDISFAEEALIMQLTAAMFSEPAP